MFVVCIRNWHQECYGRFVEREGGGGGGEGHAKGSNRVGTKDFRQLNSCGPWQKKRRSVCTIRTGTRMTYIFFCAVPH